MAAADLAAALKTDPQHWRDRAACHGYPTDWWFPNGTVSNSVEVRQARAICQDCPVRGECLDWAIRTHQPAGIWGGMGVVSRRRLGKGWKRR